MVVGYPPAINPQRLRAVEHPSTRTLPRAHLEARPSLAVPVITRHKHRCLARIRPGGGADQSGGTSRLPPRCRVAWQGTEMRRKSVVGPARRPPRPNTHGDVKGRMPRRLGHSTTLSPHVALTRAQPQRTRESHGVGSRPLMIPLVGQTPDHQRAHASRMRDRPVACHGCRGRGRRAADWTRARRDARRMPARLNLPSEHASRVTPCMQPQRSCSGLDVGQQCSIGWPDGDRDDAPSIVC